MSVAKNIPDSDKPVARRPGGRTARIRRAVFDATLDILTRDGYQSLTIESVAAKAGINKTTVYRNWPTKAALIREAAEDRSAAVITTETTGNAERDLTAFLTSVSGNIASPAGQALVIATLNEANNPRVKEARAEFWRHRFQAAEHLVRSATDINGDVDVDTVIEQLIGPLYLRAFITGAPIDGAFIRRTVQAALRLASTA
jgi:AcrR family transcriptional regulator